MSCLTTFYKQNTRAECLFKQIFDKEKNSEIRYLMIKCTLYCEEFLVLFKTKYGVDWVISVTLIKKNFNVSFLVPNTINVIRSYCFIFLHQPEFTVARYT